jgi:putative ABC transport system permease protein/lipoprotein-releasing system permease protein
MPLSAWVFLIRNPGKTGPLAGVIMLAVLLIAGIVTVMNSIPLSIQTVYGFSRFLTGITSRGDPSKIPILEERFKSSPVPIERKIRCRTTIFNVKSIVGPWPFVMYGLKADDANYFIEKFQLSKIAGRLPEPGEPEAVITEQVSVNLSVGLGDTLLGPDIDRSFSPYPVKVVGIFESKEWLSFTSYDYLAANHFPPLDVFLLFAKNQATQRQLDAWAEQSLKEDRAVVFTYPSLQRDTRETFRTLFKILNVVVGLLVVVIAIMMAMLVNIYLTQRIVEFGLLQAIGITKSQLTWRAIKEVSLVVAIGWLLGALLVYTLLSLIKRQLMDPRAFALDPLDPVAYGYTLSVPIVILLAAIITVWYRFKVFDPIAVVERRIV